MGTRRLLILGVLTILLTFGLPTAAHAEFVSSRCTTRGPINGDYVDVCVRINRSCPSGCYVFGYGALDARGPHAKNIWLKIPALHIREYYPVNGPEVGRITSPQKTGYDYINQYTPYGYLAGCGYGFKAVMSYEIHWYGGQVTSATNFYTPPGVDRWSSC